MRLHFLLTLVLDELDDELELATPASGPAFDSSLCTSFFDPQPSKLRQTNVTQALLVLTHIKRLSEAMQRSNSRDRLGSRNMTGKFPIVNRVEPGLDKCRTKQLVVIHNIHTVDTTMFEDATCVLWINLVSFYLLLSGR